MNQIFGLGGKVAGIGGLGIALFLLTIQGFFQQKLVAFGFDLRQIFKLFVAVLLLAFGVSALGIVAWLVDRLHTRANPIPSYVYVTITILVLMVLSPVLLLIIEAHQEINLSAALPSPVQTTTMKQSPTPTVTYRICTGEYEKNCQPHDAYLYCYSDVNAWANARCGKPIVQNIASYDGNKCGYGIYNIICGDPH